MLLGREYILYVHKAGSVINCVRKYLLDIIYIYIYRAAGVV